MAITSLEFKRIDVEFGRRLESVDKELYEAIGECRSKEEVAKEIKAAKEILIEYESILKTLDEIKRAQFKDDYGDSIVDIMNGMAKLE